MVTWKNSKDTTIRYLYVLEMYKCDKTQYLLEGCHIRGNQTNRTTVRWVHKNVNLTHEWQGVRRFGGIPRIVTLQDK